MFAQESKLFMQRESIRNLLETRALYKALRELIPSQLIELLRQHRPAAAPA